MSGRFWCKIRVYKNRSPGRSFKVSTNLFVWNDVELIGPSSTSNAISDFQNCEKRKKYFTNFHFFFKFHLQVFCLSKKKRNICYTGSFIMNVTFEHLIRSPKFIICAWILYGYCCKLNRVLYHKNKNTQRQFSFTQNQSMSTPPNRRVCWAAVLDGWVFIHWLSPGWTLGERGGLS